MTDEQVRTLLPDLLERAAIEEHLADGCNDGSTLEREHLAWAQSLRDIAAHLEAGLADREQAAGMSGVTRCLTCRGEGFLAGYCAACHESAVIRAEAAEAERDALKQNANRTLLLAKLAAAQDRAHYAATERDAMAEKLEWLREHGLHVRLHGPKYHEHMGISKVFGSLQDDAEFYANLAAAVAAENGGGDGA